MKLKQGTKIATAVEIVKKHGLDRDVRHVAIDDIMATCGMTKAGSTTYYHNALNYIKNMLTQA